MITTKSSHLLARSILLCLGGFAVAAQASTPSAASTPQPQDASAASAIAKKAKAATNLKAVTVTGSRVLSSGFYSPTPVTDINQEQIQMAAPDNIADYLNTLPIMTGTNSTTQGNNGISAGKTGLSLVNLRGLGPDRTLVLVDGHRYVGSTLDGNVDVGALPTGLIKSVEIVTGGASSVYGSDAVAGVVNFILDKNYTGIKGFMQTGESKYNDGARSSVGVTLGQAFAGGRGHFLLDAEYMHSDGVGSVRDRPWYRGWGTMLNPNWTATNGEPNAITVPFLNHANEAPGGLITSGSLKWTTFEPDGTPRTFDPGLLARTGSNSSGGELDGHYAAQSLRGASERHNLFTRGSFKLTDDVEIYAEGSHARSVVNTHSSYNYFGGSLKIYRENPYLSPSTQQLMDQSHVKSASYGLLLGIASPRVEVNTNRAVIGLTSRLGSNWDLDTYYQYGESKLYDQVLNTTNSTRLNLAIDAVVDPASGNVVCRSSLSNPGNGCVPINTFGGANMSDQAVAYVQGAPWFRQKMTQQVLSATVRGDAFMIPAGAVVTAFGLEQRREGVKGSSDEAGQNGEWLFGNFLPTHGNNRVTEGFGEILVPLLENKLSFNGAARVAKYSRSGTAFTWKTGLTWQPTQWLMVRAVRSRDIRAPNLADSYQAGLTQRQNVNDPWFDDVRRNIERVSEGNLDLKPEIADTKSAGLVFTSGGRSTFQGSVDYYQIDIRDAITTLTNQQTVDRCFDGDPELCQYVERDASGALSGLTIKPINIAKRIIHGVDTDLIYDQPLPFIASNASLETRVIATRLLKSLSENPFSTSNYVGENTGSSPRWRALGTVTYRQGPLRLGASVRFVSKGELNNQWVDGVNIDDNQVPSTWYLGLSGSYRFAKGRFQAYARVSNLLNKAPLVIATEGNGLNATLYDVMGRYTTVGLRFRF